MPSTGTPRSNATATSKLSGATKSVNRTLEAKTRALAGWKGYTTNLVGQPATFVIDAYHQLWHIEKAFRSMDRWQYLMVLGACLLLTAPLEWLGSGVYRHARRIVLAVAPVAAVFVVWDVVAIAAHVWTYNPRYVSGLKPPGALPLEELLFSW